MDGAERTFHAMGSEIRVIIGPSARPGLSPPGIAAIEAEALIHEFDRRLSRFLPDSELSRMNRDLRSSVPASALLRAAMRAGIWAAERSRGLVDPTLLDEIEEAGYASTREGLEPAPLAEALAAAPPRRPAAARNPAEWRRLRVAEKSGEVRRPPSLRFDSGGIGKGLAADLAGAKLSGYGRFAVDCGGDVRVGGADPDAAPFEIEIRHPLTGAAAGTISVRAGAIATSGLDVNVWRLPDGGYAHHLLDPATGKPAWTGLVGATALGPTAVAAETLAKAALLSGPEGAEPFLREHGGLIVREDGSVERFGPLTTSA